jgi:hypothetical protein
MLKNKGFSDPSRTIFPVAFCLGVIVFLASSYYINFQVVLNDFWGVLYYSRHLSLSEPASLYNGFFPIGYPFLLHFIPYSYVVFFAFALNILFSGLFLGWISNLIYMLRKSIWGAVFVFWVTLLYPLFFQYSVTTSPDIGAAALSIGGVYFLWKRDLVQDSSAHLLRDDLIAGLLFGIAALFRSHGVISAAAILAGYFVVMGMRRIWERKYLLISLALVYSIQIGANLLSGHGALETGQNFTAYISFFGMDWWHIPPAVYSFSVVSQFFKDPTGFIAVFMPLFLRLVVYGLPSLMCLILLRGSLERKFVWFVLIATLGYSLPVAIGTSATDRGPFPILGITVTCLGLLGLELWSRGKKILSASKLLHGLAVGILASSLLWVAAGWISQNMDFLNLNLGQNKNLHVIEAKLVAKGLKKPAEVFTNKFGLYLPDIPPYRPYSNGGWEDYSLWNYRQEFPEIPTDSWETFLQGCKANHIRFLALSPGADAVAGFLSDLYNERFTPDGVDLILNIGRIKIFQIKS